MPELRRCIMCPAELEGRRAHSQTCSARCRKALSRRGPPTWVEQRARWYGLSEGDFWRTNPAMFSALDREFCFGLDAAATADDALCNRFLTPDDDALTTQWPIVETGLEPAAFVNPPYSSKGGRGRGLRAWVDACARERARQHVVLVVPSTFATAWARRLRELADEVRHPEVRIPYVAPPGLEESSARHETMVGIFRRGSRGPAIDVTWPVPALRSGAIRSTETGRRPADDESRTGRESVTG